MEITILEFDGYYTDADLPREEYACSGIYVVHAGERSSYRMKKLLYIGESEDVGHRPGKQHGKYRHWLSELESSDDGLFYSFARVDPTDRERVEAALIYRYQPPCNIEGKERFNYYAISIKCSGKIGCLEEAVLKVAPEV